MEEIVELDYRSPSKKPRCPHCGEMSHWVGSGRVNQPGGAWGFVCGYGQNGLYGPTQCRKKASEDYLKKFSKVCKE